MLTVSKEDAIKLNLYKQSLFDKKAQYTEEGLLELVNNLGCVQIDTLNVLTRSHNLVFWSRLVNYKEEYLVEAFQKGLLFESYVHALSMLPIKDFPYWKEKLAQFKSKIFEDKDNLNFLFEIYNFVKDNHPVSSEEVTKAFYQENSPSLQTWEMSSTKSALEDLWRSGLIQQVRTNNNFKKYYYPTDKVISKTLLKKSVSTYEMYETYTIKALKAMGIATEKDISDYFRISVTQVKNILNDLLKKKVIRTVNLEHDRNLHYVLEEDMELLSSQLQNIQPVHSTFLSPFDNLVWFRVRMMRLFEVDFRLESYIPENKRKYGYFALPILIRGRIVGTIDLKFEKSKKVLTIKKLNFYNEFETETYIRDVIDILDDLKGLLEWQKIEISKDKNECNKAESIIFQKI